MGVQSPSTLPTHVTPGLAVEFQEKELLRHPFGLSHGTSANGPSAIHIILLFGGGAIVCICGRRDARYWETNRQRVSFGIQAHGWDHTEQSPPFCSGLGRFNSHGDRHVCAGNDGPKWFANLSSRLCIGPVFARRPIANISIQYSPQQFIAKLGY